MGWSSCDCGRCCLVFRRHFGLLWTWMILAIINLCIIKLVESGRNCIGHDIKCVNGQCVDESQTRSKLNDTKSNDVNKTPKVSCQCDQRWSGPSCDIFSCSGRMHMEASDGVITDGTGNYTIDNKCTWLIDAGLDLPVRLKFKDFATECGWDHLYIFDGTSVLAPLIGVLSGLIVPQNSPNYVMTELTASSGSAYLYFYSDAAYNMSGFTIEYKYALCSENCSGHGDCLGNGSCHCNDGWIGVTCAIPLCPNNCSFPNGTCYKDGCNCFLGYKGDDCSIPPYKGFWSKVNYASHADSAPQGVASHSSFIDQKFLWIFGGYGFQSQSSSLLIRRYDIEKKFWENIRASSDSGSDVPAARYGHSALFREIQKVAYIYGGAMGSTVTDELWQFNLATSVWHLSTSSGTTKAIAAVGHTAQIVGNFMFVFFGHNPTYGFLNTVQCFLFDNDTWIVLATSGAIVKGGYGASSVYDSMNKTILIHGGYHSDSISTYSLTDVLYSFDPVNFSWKVLRGSGQFKYLHSAALLGRYMFIFGGNTHNDTSVSQGAKCYSLDFMAYDIDCDQWSVLDQPSFQPSAARFGHSANVYNGDLYVFGGFNGLLLSDLLVYKTGDCSSVSKDNCLSMKKEGLSCVLINQERCSPQDAAEMNLNNIEIMERATCSHRPPDTCEKDKLKTCPTCLVNSQDCVWCGSECQPKQSTCNAPEKLTREAQCYANTSQSLLECINLHNCHACGMDPGCTWNGPDNNNKCDAVRPGQMPSNKTCYAPCFTHSTCENCTRASCMWCGNQQQCVESNAYVTSFPYGQCMEWTTLYSKCPATRCTDLKTCGQCQQNPSCGWCDDGTNTGLGFCMEGGLEGPAATIKSQCPSGDWHFTSCPLCLCNGHSNCSANSSICLSCRDMTAGPNCDYCVDGFWGSPIVGGNCSACECSNQADFCNRDTGLCYCRTRGVIGDHCQECDKAHKYFGDPLNGGTCFYEMTIDWIFTFNLSSEENKYYTQINFMSTPTSKDRDVDFSITCSSDASMNMSVKTATDTEEQFLLLNHSCRSFTSKFSHKEFNFGAEHNTTFFVYIYNFQTPFTLQVYFSQNEQLDLFRFFVTFFSCFFSLLLIAFVSWKLKQRYDQYRRGQRHIQEMAQMANRPFSTCTLELDSPQDEQLLRNEQMILRSSGRRKRDCKATPVTVEPLFGQKAAVLSVIVRLPKGDDEYTPSDQSGLAIGSALVTFGGHSRQSSMDPSKQERTGKHRKKPNVIITNLTPDVV